MAASRPCRNIRCHGEVCFLIDPTATGKWVVVDWDSLDREEKDRLQEHGPFEYEAGKHRPHRETCGDRRPR